MAVLFALGNNGLQAKHEFVVEHCPGEVFKAKEAEGKCVRIDKNCALHIENKPCEELAEEAAAKKAAEMSAVKEGQN